MTHKQMYFDTSNSDRDFILVENSSFPQTRYQGSKRRIIEWIWQKIEMVDFNSILDAFGGTGVVSHKAKRLGYQVVYNDYLSYNHNIGRGIIENSNVKIEDADIEFITTRHNEHDYPSFIQDTFQGLYFTDEENRWLDTVRHNIKKLDNEYKKSLLISVIGQACLAKRPYNLFHRANLDMRLKEDVDRSFGNKKTWEKTFESHVSEKAEEFNDAVFDNGKDNRAYSEDVLNWSNIPDTDVVYLDPPYYDSTKGRNSVDYRFFYHFLNGFVQYDEWSEMIDYSTKTNRIDTPKSVWEDKDKVYDAFENMFDTFSDRTIVLSYNSTGLPTAEEIIQSLEEHKNDVTVFCKDYQYSLSKNKKQELLFIAQD